MSENLWGDLTEQTTGPSPIGLLREQAAELTKATKGLLVGLTSTTQVTNTTDLICNLTVRVPALGNYEATLLSIRQPLRVYPLNLTDKVAGKTIACENYDVFYNNVKSLLSSAETKKILSGLWVQAVKPT